MTTPRELLERVRKDQDVWLSETEESAIQQARRRLLQSASTGPTRSNGRYLLVSTLVVVLLGLVAVRPWEEQPLTFRVDGQVGEVGAWIGATGLEEPHKLQFSDATELALTPGTLARVSALDDERVEVVIEDGETAARVTSGKDRVWSFLVGPFEVTVVGTEFDVGWLGERRRFELELEEGEVRVRGPLIGSEGRVVRQPERLVVDLRAGRVDLATGGEENQLAQSEGAVAPVDGTDDIEVHHGSREPGSTAVVEGGEAGIVAAPTVARGRRASQRVALAPSPAHEALEAEAVPELTGSALAPGPRWRDLARAGDYRQALAAADVDAVLSGGSADDLLRLGDAARLAGDLATARRLYLALWERFQGRPGATAAFALGRLAMEGGAGSTEAARWFGESISRDPSGPLAREAEGRRVEALSQSGNHAAARDAAARYLRRHPEGPHAGVARSVLE